RSRGRTPGDPVLADGLARSRRQRRTVAGRVHGRVPLDARTDLRMSERTGGTRPDVRAIGATARAIITRAPRAIGRLIRLLVVTLAGVVRTTWLAGESWLLDEKKSIYGLAVTRIVL